MDKTESILREDLERKLNRADLSVNETLNRIEKEGNLLNDFVSQLGVDATGKPIVSFSSNGDLKAHVNGNDLTIHPHAVTQAGEKLGIVTKYIKGLANGCKWKRDLAAHVLNEHSMNTKRSRVLVREVDGQIRGIMSDQYKRLNTTTIYADFIQAVKSQGAEIIDAFVDDTRSYVETVLPQIVPVPTAKNGTVYMVFGVRISNSDFGDGALNVRSYSTQVVCMNGMTRDNLMNKIHLGAKIPDNLQLSEKTYQLETKHHASVINDLVKQVYSQDYILKQAEAIQFAANSDVDLEKEVKSLSKMGVLKDEVKQVQNILVNNRRSDGIEGEPTVWKLSQALTAVARDAGGRRKREIEEIGGKLLNTIV